MKEYNLPYESFIGGWFISESICDSILEYSKDHKDLLIPGKQGDFKVDLSKKHSFDFPIPYNLLDQNTIFGQYRKELQECLHKYIDRYPEVNKNMHFNIVTDYNFQYYPPGGGFKQWHFERGGPHSTKRILTFMTYLNSIEEGGTEFLYQKITSPAKKGLTLIWPTDFTHTHRGQICNEEKFIITGWYEYI